MTMVNMQMSAEEAKEQCGMPSPGNMPKYPYGLCLQLDDDALAKLGIQTPPVVGTKMMLTAVVEVTAVRSQQDQNGEDESSMDLQVTDMELASGGPSFEERAAQKLYG